MPTATQLHAMRTASPVAARVADYAAPRGIQSAGRSACWQALILAARIGTTAELHAHGEQCYRADIA